MCKTKPFDFSARGRATVGHRQLASQMGELRMSFIPENNSSCKSKVYDDTTLWDGPYKSGYTQCTSPGVPPAKEYMFFSKVYLAKGRDCFASH